MRSVKAAVAASVLVVVLGAYPCVAADSATLKLRDGRVVTGKVQGHLLLKDLPLLHVRGQDQVHLVRYTLVSGNDVLAIDERGVQLDGATIRVAVAGQSGSLPDDARIFQSLCDSMGATGAGLMSLNEKGSLATDHVLVTLWGIGSPLATGSGNRALAALGGYVGLHAPTARLAGRLAGAQAELFDSRVRAMHKETGKKTFVLPDEVVGYVQGFKGRGKTLALCVLGGALSLAAPSGAAVVPIAALVQRTPPTTPDALGGLEADNILARRLDEFFVRDIEINSEAFSMSIVMTKKDEPAFEHVVVGPITSEGVDMPPEAAKAFEAALVSQVAKRGFKGVSTASGEQPPPGSRVLEFAALVIPRVSRPVVALKGVDRASGAVVYAMAIPLYQLGKGGMAKQLTEATIHFARYIKPRL